MDPPEFTRPKRAQRSRLYWAGLVTGIGIGMVVANILYRRFPISSLRDLIWLAAMALIITGERLARRIPSRRNRHGLRRFRNPA